MSERVQLLERYARAYAREGFAVIWTNGLQGDDDAAKKVTSKSWETTRPLPDPEFAAGLFAQRGLKRNPAITARTSGLVLIDCDTPEGLAEIEALDLPPTWTVRSSADWKRHFYFRQPDVETLPKVGFRFETAGLTADLNRYLVAPPAIHPKTGEPYAFLDGLGPDEVELATLPASAYRELLARAETDDNESREAIRDDPTAKVRQGKRRETVFKKACQERRWSADEEEIVELVMRWNLAHCEPPLSREQVEHQVHGAMKKEGEQELVAASSVPPPDDPDTRTNESEPAPLSGKDVRPVTPAETRTKRPQLALADDILARFRSDVRRAGLAGERRAAQLSYLALTSRLLHWGKPTNRPVSGIGKGTSGSGKSYTLEQVLRFFPESAYVDLGSMSKRFLFYTEEEFAHRFLIVPEWATIADDEEIVSMLRILLSAGRIIHGTVEGEGKRKARRIEKPGPTGLLMTTTRASTDEELETRCLSFLTDDSQDQTRRVFRALARLEYEDESPVDFEPWHDLQRWLAESGEARVVIPYVRALANLMPTVATRLRRDFVSMLCLVRAHAILHQATRERDDQGRIIATITDYSAVRDLVSEIIGEAVEATVSPAMRQTVEAVAAILDESNRDYIGVKALDKRLAVGRSATYDRIRRALRAGYLVNTAKEDERAYKLALGAEMPGGGAFLPDPDDVVRVMSRRPTGQATPHEDRESEVLSGSPGRPADPQDGEELEWIGTAALAELQEHFSEPDQDEPPLELTLLEPGSPEPDYRATNELLDRLAAEQRQRLESES